MIIIGVDPGINGAACAFWRADKDGPEFVADAIDLPTRPDNSNTQIDVAALIKWLNWCRPAYAFIENVSAMPSQPDAFGKRRGMGATSAFRFGFATGQLRAALTACRTPTTLVVSRVWKKAYGLKGGDKEASRQLALTMFPAAAPYLKRKKDHQRAEAMLLAKWGERHLWRNGH